jgi:hypothetical protein
MRTVRPQFPPSRQPSFKTVRPTSTRHFGYPSARRGGLACGDRLGWSPAPSSGLLQGAQAPDRHGGRSSHRRCTVIQTVPPPPSANRGQPSARRSPELHCVSLPRTGAPVGQADRMETVGMPVRKSLQCGLLTVAQSLHGCRASVGTSPDDLHRNAPNISQMVRDGQAQRVPG